MVSKEVVAIEDLNPEWQYLVTAIETVESKQIVVELDGGQILYIPTLKSDELLKNSAELMLFEEAANKFKLVIQSLDGHEIQMLIV